MQICLSTKKQNRDGCNLHTGPGQKLQEEIKTEMKKNVLKEY